ncbi:MAG: arginine/lysine/histidine transporter system substrate-binding protein [Candidatus Petromonas sp.]|jgi:polar amino acid transport system substrate-binding protein|nr:arginine/lysine/histidine transporter system substrate-binding protein [Candidatus Petromonas sp.]
MFDKKMKGLISILLIGLMIFTFTACQQQETANQDTEAEGEKQKAEVVKTKLDEIKANGKIVLGTAADYPPYEFHKVINGKDEIVGFDIEIAKQIAKDLGVELEIKDMKFDGLLAALVADDIDFILAGMVPKPERKKSVDFSIPYYAAEQKMLVRADVADKIKTIEDLKGFKIGVQKSTVQEDIAKEKIQPNVEGVEVKGLSKITDLVLELKNGKIDGIVLVEPVAMAYGEQNEDLAVPEISFGQEAGVAVAVNKGNAKLLDAINKSLQKMLDEGKIDKFITDATLLSEQE